MTVKHTSRTLLFILITTILAFTGCRKDEFNTDPAYKLEFSADTVVFDTVFTTVGSSTRSLVIRNTANQKINIAKITLARGKASPFRLNIDGEATEEFHDLEIAANDSAYIFVKVTIDPNNVNSPLIESDSVVFQINGTLQNVKLVAWGQDAYFHINTKLTGVVNLPDDKPHVIYGTLSAENGCKLSIGAGTRLYFHPGSSLEIRSGASLTVAGTLEAPVTFTGDRLEDDYLEISGMWDGIWLEKGCTNISFTYSEITNAKTGIQADNTGSDYGDTLKLHNCMIHNITNYGILATDARIFASNCQISNCGGNVVSIVKGGDYDFRNCTLANFFSGRSYPALAISNYSADTTGTKFPGELNSAYFGNCIITGYQTGEIDFNELEGYPFNFLFDHCLASWDKTLYKKYESKFIACISNEDAKLIDPSKNNFQLDTLSFAKDAASMDIINNWHPDILHDRKGISRLGDGLPDIGAYERVE